jgi:Ran GTPase-activating protein (RanGAP) involved in mRNA processing and transport
LCCLDLAFPPGPTGESDSALLCAALADNTSVRELLLSGHALSEEGARHFGAALRKNRTLRRLALGNASFGDKALEALLESWCNETLAHLDLELKGLSAAAMPALLAVLRTPSGLVSLHLGRNALGDEGAAVLAEGLRWAALERLDLHDCGVGEAGCRRLGEALHVRERCAGGATIALLLDGNPIGNAGLVALATAAAHGPHALPVAELSVEGCSVGEAGVAALAGAAQQPGSSWAALRTLRLGSNRLRDASCITGLLSQLHRLQLERNALGLASAALEAALLQLPRGGVSGLELLDLSSNKIEPDASLMRALGAAPVAELRLLGNSLGEAGANALMQAVRATGTASVIRVLSLTGVGLTDCTAVLAAARDCPNLRTLELGANAIGDAGFSAVERLRDERHDLDIAVDKNPEEARQQHDKLNSFVHAGVEGVEAPGEGEARPIRGP